jgi:hypothetical protein
MTINKTAKTFDEFSRKTLEQASSLGEINLHFVKGISNRHTDTVNLAVKHSADMAKVLAGTKDYRDFFSAQVEASKSLYQGLITVSRENVEFATKAFEAYQAWYKKGLTEVAADLRKAIPAA